MKNASDLLANARAHRFSVWHFLPACVVAYGGLWALIEPLGMFGNGEVHFEALGLKGYVVLILASGVLAASGLFLRSAIADREVVNHLLRMDGHADNITNSLPHGTLKSGRSPLPARSGEMPQSAPLPTRNWLQPELSGLTGYYQLYPIHEMIDCLSEARDEIFIQQTWISNFNELCHAFKVALQRAKESRRKLRIRIILIDPDSPACEARGVQSGQPPKRTRKLVRSIIEQIEQDMLEFQLKEDFEIRYSRENATFALFGADSTVYFNPYLRQLNTYQSPCLRFEGGEKSIYRDLRKHFDTHWDALEKAPDSLNQTVEHIERSEE